MLALRTRFCAMCGRDKEVDFRPSCVNPQTNNTHKHDDGQCIVIFELS